MIFVRDTREKAGFDFVPPMYPDCQTVPGTLELGDYSIKGAENLVAVERKSLPDLIMCLGVERERFERELRRARALEAFCVVVEGTWADVKQGNYRSRMNPGSALQTILAFSCRYRCQFLFAGNHTEAEYATFGFLRHYARGKLRHLEALQKAMIA